jgi:hypothetical protein
VSDHGGDYWCFNGAQRDFMFDASKNADVTGKNQVVHMHAHGEPCEGHDHHLVEPDPARMVAVGGDLR